jgi:nucleoside-diphosphate-sugar epimerase
MDNNHGRNKINYLRYSKMTTHKKKKVIIAGGSGLIGSNLAKALVERDYEVVVLTRHIPAEKNKSDKIRIAQWDGQHLSSWRDEINGAYAVINLAGASITGENLLSILFDRWTKRRKELIRQSRVSSGEILADAIDKAIKKPEVFIQASGVGYYGTASSLPGFRFTGVGGFHCPSDFYGGSPCHNPVRGGIEHFRRNTSDGCSTNMVIFGRQAWQWQPTFSLDPY